MHIHSCEAIMANPCAVLTGSEPVAIGLNPLFAGNILALTRMPLMDLGLLNVTIISLLVNGLMVLNLSNIPLLVDCPYFMW